VVQRHQIETPPGELDELEKVVQRLSDDEMTEATTRVNAAVAGAASVKKTRNPILHNTGKALTKGNVTRSVHNIDDPTKKAWVSGQSKTVNLGGKWVLGHPINEIQGALAHEVAHVLAGPGLDEYQDEFNAYWAEVMSAAAAKPGVAPATARLRTSTEMQQKVPVIQGFLVKYGWWSTASAAKKQKWAAISAPAGFNTSNSWKQKQLLELMSASSPAPQVVALVKRMNKIDRVEARSAQRPDSSLYLAWTNYSAPDKAAIWRALGGTGAAP
jgi:hypothetical protein